MTFPDDRPQVVFHRWYRTDGVRLFHLAIDRDPPPLTFNG